MVDTALLEMKDILKEAKLEAFEISASSQKFSMKINSQ